MYARHLIDFCVDPNAQGRGVGKLLMNWGLQQASAADPPLAVWLESSPAGYPIYLRFGFEEVDRIAVPDNSNTESMILPAMLWQTKAASEPSKPIKYTREELLIEQVLETDLPRCAEIMFHSFATAEDAPYVRPLRLRNNKRTDAERITEQCQRMKKWFFDKKGTIMLKATVRKTHEIVGLAIWEEPGAAPLAKGESKADDTRDPEIDWDYFDGMLAGMAGLKKKLLGTRPCWCVLPRPEDKGQASADKHSQASEDIRC